MKELLLDIIELLKLQVKRNLEIINQNQEIIKELSSNLNSAPQSATYFKHYIENKNLLAENNDFTNLQLTLVNFLKKYNDSSLFNNNEPCQDINSQTDEEAIFDLTIGGKIPYTNGHPFFQDEKFFYRLLTFYEAKEQYEKCQEIVDSKRKNR